VVVDHDDVEWEISILFQYGCDSVTDSAVSVLNWHDDRCLVFENLFVERNALEFWFKVSADLL
jgi:hypothetical protein